MITIDKMHDKKLEKIIIIILLKKLSSIKGLKILKFNLFIVFD